MKKEAASGLLRFWPVFDVGRANPENAFYSSFQKPGCPWLITLFVSRNGKTAIVISRYEWF